MKLSEAIRLGSLWSAQGFGMLADADSRTCALGAAALALGVDPAVNEGMRYAVLRARYPLLDERAECPACSLPWRLWRQFRQHETDVEDFIIHLNDDHRWTRERIAQWVEGLEAHAFRTTTTTSRQHELTSQGK